MLFQFSDVINKMAGQDNCALETSANWKLVRTQSLHAFNIFIENKTYFLSDQVMLYPYKTFS